MTQVECAAKSQDGCIAAISSLGAILEKVNVRMAIDPDFRKKRKKAGKEEGIAVWGPVDPPEKLGIRGTVAGVDWDICRGCGICLEVCPMNVYEWGKILCAPQ